jgi:hypothetical protein
MTTITCKRCGEDKAADAMIVRAGKPSRLCRDCFAISFAGRGKAKSGWGSVKAKAEKAPPPVRLNGHALEILAGYGFRARVEDDRLVIEQDDSEGNTADLILSRTEAKVLFAQFGEWAG